MKSLSTPFLLLALLTAPALAQQKTEDHTGHHAGGTSGAVANDAEFADGEVRRIDREAGKLTLRHGEIRSLDMPGMTMVFQVRDPSLLESIKVGDKVRFRAERSGSAYVVTVIEAAN